MTIQVSLKWRDLINYIGLKEEHLSLLHEHKDYFEKYSPEIVTNFYARIVKNDKLSNIVMNHSTFDRLTKTQSMYFKNLFSKKIDELYIMYVEKIGSTHFRIGLTPEWYLGGVHVYMEEVYNFCQSLDNGLEIYHAFCKRIMFDTQVALLQFNALKEKRKS